MLEQSDHEFSIQLQGQNILSPVRPIVKTENNAFRKNALAYFPDSQPTSESTSINSHHVFNVFHPGGIPVDPYKNVYDYRGSVP